MLYVTIIIIIIILVPFLKISATPYAKVLTKETFS